MAVLPSDIPTGLVTGQFFFVNEDNIDADTDPELTVVSGKVTFTCEATDPLRMPTKKAVIIPMTFDAEFDSEGRLVPKGRTDVGIELPASDSPLFNPTGFTWKVEFDLVDVATGYTVVLPSFSIFVPEGETSDLVDLMPVSTEGGVLTTQGPQGPQGPQGIQGIQGEQGAPGVADDASIAAQINNTGSTTRAALNATIGSKTGIAGQTETLALANNADAGTVTVALTGHSLLYGQDTTSGTTLPAVNGASQTRSVTPPAVVFSDALAKVMRSAATRAVINQTRPGDQTQIGTGNAVDRWATGASGDIEIFWLDTNDALNYGGFGTGRLTAAQSAEGLRILIERTISRGAQPIVLGGLPVNTAGSVRRIQAFSEGHRRTAERYGAPYVDAAELLRGLPRATAKIWGTSEAVHLSPAAYAMIGAKLAALVGPHGANPRTVAPGTIIRPLEWVHVGGNLAGRADGGTGVVDGQVIRLAAGESVSFPLRVITPIQPIVELSNVNSGSGEGTGRILFADAQALIKSIHIDTTGAPRGISFVRGHVMDTGPDVVTIQCDTGTLEIAAVRFVAAENKRYSGLRTSLDVQQEKAVTQTSLSGLSITGPDVADWRYHMDENAALNLITPGNTGLYAARYDFVMDLPEPSAPGRWLGVAVAASAQADNLSYWLRSGWVIARTMITADASRLSIRPWVSGAIGTDTNISGVFPVTGLWRGAISVEFLTNGSMQVRVDGVVRHTVAAASQPYRHFVPLVGGNLGSADRVTALAVSAQGHAAST